MVHEALIGEAVEQAPDHRVLEVQLYRLGVDIRGRIERNRPQAPG